MSNTLEKHHHCQECGMLLNHPAEFHPYEFCILKKSGQDPRVLYNRIVNRIQSGTFDTDNPITQAIRDFMPTSEQRAGYEALISWLESTTPFTLQEDTHEANG